MSILIHLILQFHVLEKIHMASYNSNNNNINNLLNNYLFYLILISKHTLGWGVNDFFYD